MRKIGTFDEILKLAETGNLYVRWSRGPKLDKRQKCSRDYVSGGTHAGLSCQKIKPDNPHTITAMMLVEYRFLRRKDSGIHGWLFYGTENGTDSDGAPTVDADSIKPVAQLSNELVEKLCAFNTSYWDHHNNRPRTFAEQAEWLNSYPKLEDYL